MQPLYMYILTELLFDNHTQWIVLITCLHQNVYMYTFRSRNRVGWWEQCGGKVSNLRRWRQRKCPSSRRGLKVIISGCERQEENVSGFRHTRLVTWTGAYFHEEYPGPDSGITGRSDYRVASPWWSHVSGRCRVFAKYGDQSYRRKGEWLVQLQQCRSCTNNN